MTSSASLRARCRDARGSQAQGMYKVEHMSAGRRQKQQQERHQSTGPLLQSALA